MVALGCPPYGGGGLEQNHLLSLNQSLAKAQLQPMEKLECSGAKTESCLKLRELPRNQIGAGVNTGQGHKKKK